MMISMARVISMVTVMVLVRWTMKIESVSWRVVTVVAVTTVASDMVAKVARVARVKVVASITAMNAVKPFVILLLVPTTDRKNICRPPSRTVIWFVTDRYDISATVSLYLPNERQ